MCNKNKCNFGYDSIRAIQNILDNGLYALLDVSVGSLGAIKIKRLMNLIEKVNNKQTKIIKFHADEIKLVLFICATNLSTYSDEDLVNFTECIEGRIETLFETKYLETIQDFIPINNEIIQDFQNLRLSLHNLYASDWHLKMSNKRYWKEIINQSQQLLEKLNIEYKEPKTFMDNNFEIDWI